MPRLRLNVPLPPAPRRPRLRLYVSPPPPIPRRPANLQPPAHLLAFYNGDRELANDIMEFPGAPWPNLDAEDVRVYARARHALLSHRQPPLSQKGVPYRHPRSFKSRLCHARQTLRLLKQVNDGVRRKFEVNGYCVKKSSL